MSVVLAAWVLRANGPLGVLRITSMFGVLRCAVEAIRACGSHLRRFSSLMVTVAVQSATIF